MRNEDVEPIRATVVQRFQPSPVVPPNSNTVTNRSEGEDFIPRPKPSPRLMGCGVTTLVFGAIAVGVYVSFYNRLDLPIPTPQQTPARSSCIVTTWKINVRSAPRGEVIRQLQPGAKPVTTGTELGDWIEISAPVKGWIYKKSTQPCDAVSGTHTPSVSPKTAPQPTQTPQTQRNRTGNISIPGGSTPAPQPTQTPQTQRNRTGNISIPGGSTTFSSPKITPPDLTDFRSTTTSPFPSTELPGGDLPSIERKASKSFCLATKEQWERDKQRPDNFRLHSDAVWQQTLKDWGCD